MKMEQTLLLLLAILCAIVIVLLVIVMKQGRHKNEIESENWRRQMSDDFFAFQTNMLSAIRMDMNTLNENTSNKMLRMEHNVNEQLHMNLTTTSKAFQEVMKQVVQLNQAQDQMKDLSYDIAGLHRILSDKKTRGIYGEIELYSILESAFGNNTQRYQTQYKLSNNMIVDAMLFGNGALNDIAIDSKFPLENFNRLQDESLTSAQKTVVLNEFKNDVKKHITAISQKYIIANETSEFAYMFIPAEAIFAYINANMQEVVQFSYEKKVYLVSPTTLMAYLTLIKALFLGIQKNERMQEIQDELTKLSVEFTRFVKRYESVAADYEKTYKDMKEVLISANKISKRFARIEAVELEENK